MNFSQCQRGLSILLFSVYGWARAASLTPWPEMPPVDKARLEWVAKDVWINGVPTRVQQFEAPHRPEEVLSFYRSLWRNFEAGPPRENTHAEWQMISVLHGPFQMVVQVKPDGRGGSQGLLSCVNLIELKPNYMPSGWPRHLPIKLLQVMESVDGPKRAYYMSAISERNWSHTRETLREAWRQSGWRLQAEVEDGAAYLATYERGEKTLEVSLKQKGPRDPVIVLLNLTEFFQS
ncbi:MAG: hypothetical protein ACK53K_09445 [Burkholderiales bacterium]|jgi:hypothetical protein